MNGEKEKEKRKQTNKTNKQNVWQVKKTKGISTKKIEHNTHKCQCAAS
jgi:uncharacterized protein (DUF2249 family)